MVSSSNLQGLNTGNFRRLASTTCFPSVQAMLGNRNYYAGPADKLDLKRDGLHFSYEGIYDDISPGFVTVPGFVNRVDIRETLSEADYRFRPKKGWIVDWGPSLNQRYVFDHEGNRLDTDYTLISRFKDADRRFSICFPTRNCGSGCGRRIFVSWVSLPASDCEPGLPRAQQRRLVPDQLLSEGYDGGELLLGRRSELRGFAVQRSAPLRQPFLARLDTATGHADPASHEALED